MTDNKFIEIPKIYEQYVIPTLEEIIDGKSQLPQAYIKDLRNINSEFKQEIVVFCKNSLCGCKCFSKECKCENSSIWIGGDSNGGFLSSSFSARQWKKDIVPENMDEFMMMAGGAKDLGMGRQFSNSIFNYKDSDGELKVLSGTAGGEITRKAIKGQLSADLYNVKSDGVQVRAGIALDTGISF